MAASTKPVDRLSQAALALAHPIRRGIILQIAAGVVTPVGIAKEVGEPLGVVSYHCRMLRDYRIIRVERTEPRRGALQHFYAVTDNSFGDLMALADAADTLAQIAPAEATA